MTAWLIAGRFLLLGIVAWVVAIVVGAGSLFGPWRWRERWPVAGAAAGLGVFGIWVFQHAVEMASLAALDPALVAWSAGLSVGCGLAVGYSTLFLGTREPRPRLEAGSPEERLWMHDAIDRLMPQRLDWLLTAALLAPGIGMIHLGLTRVVALTPVVFGAIALLGPVYAGVGLWLRRRSALMLQARLDEVDRVAPALVGPVNIEPTSSVPIEPMKPVPAEPETPTSQNASA